MSLRVLRMPDRMPDRHRVAVEIALQTRVLRTCPVHNQLFQDDQADPAGAFALAVELVRRETPYVEAFHKDSHALTDLLSETIAAAPECCPVCGGGERGT